MPSSLELLEGDLTITDKFGVICGTFTHKNDTSSIINHIETVHESKYNVTGSLDDKDQWNLLHNSYKESSNSSQEGKRSKKIMSFASNSSSK